LKTDLTGSFPFEFIRLAEEHLSFVIVYDDSNIVKKFEILAIDAQMLCAEVYGPVEQKIWFTCVRFCSDFEILWKFLVLLLTINLIFEIFFIVRIRREVINFDSF